MQIGWFWRLLNFMQFLLCDFIARKILSFDRNKKSGSYTLDCTQQSIDQGSSTVGLSHWVGCCFVFRFLEWEWWLAVVPCCWVRLPWCRQATAWGEIERETYFSSQASLASSWVLTCTWPENLATLFPSSSINSSLYSHPLFIPISHLHAYFIHPHSPPLTALLTPHPLPSYPLLLIPPPSPVVWRSCDSMSL